jgi:hypothetical protein
MLFYAKVTMGRKQRFRTRAVEPGPSGAAWNEEFVLAVGADDEEVEVAVARRRRDGRRRREVVGAVRLPVPAASAELATAALGERRSVPPTEGRRRRGSGGLLCVRTQVRFRKLLDAIDIFFRRAMGCLDRAGWCLPLAFGGEATTRVAAVVANCRTQARSSGLTCGYQGVKVVSSHNRESLATTKSHHMVCGAV